jgi:hypothetical protein
MHLIERCMKGDEMQLAGLSVQTKTKQVECLQLNRKCIEIIIDATN